MMPAPIAISLPTVRGLSPRIGPNYMLYLSSKGGDDGIRKLVDGEPAEELWSGSLGRVVAGPAISPDGRRIAFTAQKGGRNRLYLMNSDGTGVTELATFTERPGRSFLATCRRLADSSSR